MMMPNKTLGRYFSAVFLRNICVVFLACLCIILLVDLVERLREFGSKEWFSFPLGVQMALLRAPSLAEQVLPFAVLLGAIAAFINLTRKLEIAVTRAAGVSIWQFLQPGLLVAILLGVLGSCLYNPAAVYLEDVSKRLEERGFRLADSARWDLPANVWFRQDGPDGESIVSAERALNNGQTLLNVTVLVFDTSNILQEQVDAAIANLKDGYWELNAARIVTASAPPLDRAVYQLSTYLTKEQVEQQVESGGKLTFWALPAAIELAERAGLKSDRLRLEFHSLLARPLFFAAMVIIAATVSLKLTRMGNVGRFILGGIGAGFVLYVVSELVRDLGANGLLHPALAAWLPATIALLLGVTILLFQEDG